MLSLASVFVLWWKICIARRATFGPAAPRACLARAPHSRCAPAHAAGVVRVNGGTPRENSSTVPPGAKPFLTISHGNRRTSKRRFDSLCEYCLGAN